MPAASGPLRVYWLQHKQRLADELQLDPGFVGPKLIFTELELDVGLLHRLTDTACMLHLGRSLDVRSVRCKETVQLGLRSETLQPKQGRR